MLPKDGPHALRARPAIDVPPMAQASAALPAAVVLPAAPPVRIASPSSADAPVDTIVAKADTGRPTLITDDTLNLAPPAALELTPPPRSAPAPFLLLAIPDPTRQAGEIPAPQIARDDAPVPNFDRPTRPTLPASK